MLASRARLVLLGVRASNHGILPRGLGPHASSPWHGGAAQRLYHHHHRQQQQEEDEREDSKAVKVAVWWDFERCRLPPRVNSSWLAPRVTAALRRAGILGPVEFTAFGDVTRTPPAEQEALVHTGVALTHVPSGGNDGYFQSFMPDLVSWIAQNPPPAHFLLISGDEDYAKVLHRLRLSNYNVLICCPNASSKMLHSAATFMWLWEPLVTGVDLEPRYLNQPPDGFSSWYGQYRECGQDLLVKQKNPMPLPRNTKEPKVPRSVVIGIKQVLYFYPEGVSVQTLQAELKRINVFIDRGFFGFRRFSALLEAMPDVVKFRGPLPGDTQPAVVGVFKRSVESSEQSSFNRMDSAQSSIEQKHRNKSESKELSSWDDQPSSELPSCTEKKTLEAELPSPRLDQLSRHQRRAPGLTQRAEPPSNHVEADVTLAGDVPSPPSDAPPRDQRNASAVDLKKTERSVSSMEADKMDAAGTPSSSVSSMEADKMDAAGTPSSNKGGLFERISSLWNGRKD